MYTLCCIHRDTHTIVDNRIQPIVVHAHKGAERLELAEIAKVETVNVQTVRPLGRVRLLRKLRVWVWSFDKHSKRKTGICCVC